MTTPIPPPLVVVKVGGSLYDWPELGPRLQQFVATLAGRSVVLVPGGGRLPTLFARLDAAHHLGDAAAHWLTLAASAPRPTSFLNCCRDQR